MTEKEVDQLTSISNILAETSSLVKNSDITFEEAQEILHVVRNVAERNGIPIAIKDDELYDVFDEWRDDFFDSSSY